MKRLLLKLLPFVTLTQFAVYAADNVLLPNARLSMSYPVENCCDAFSILGEIGARNFRANGSYGTLLSESQLVKVSAEFLTQKINYRFPLGHEHKWVPQYALGGEYRYLLDEIYTPIDHINFCSINAGLAYSHAFDKHINSTQHIDGSNGFFSFIGSTLIFPEESSLDVAITYDRVRYERRFFSDVLAQGLGATFNYCKPLHCDTDLNLIVELRRPFQFYEASLNWTPQLHCGAFTFGLYANYTHGQKGLRDVVSGGFQINFNFGKCSNGCIDEEGCEVPCDCLLMDWISRPAVYIPTVLTNSSYIIEN